MAKRALALLLLAGCCGAEPQPPDANAPSGDPDLQKVCDALSSPRTLRVRFRGQWPNAVAQMPRTVSGLLLLGDGARAKISMTVATAFGRPTTFDAVSDGSRLWRSPNVESRKFNPGAAGLRVELLYMLSWHGLGWAFPHGTHPSTIGEGYVVLDMVPKPPDTSPSRLDPPDGALGVISHACPNVDYRIRLSFDAASHQLRKRELIGDKGRVWYVETYEIEANPGLSDGEFKIPQ
jgi:hypothetical protein